MIALWGAAEECGRAKLDGVWLRTRTLSQVAADEPDVAASEPDAAVSPVSAHLRGPSRVLRLWQLGTQPLVLGCLGIYLISRAVGFIAILTSTWLAPNLHVGTAYTAWDAAWYLRIAEHGYPTDISPEFGVGNRWPFFPGFPLVIRLLHEVTTLSYPHAAILAAWLLGGSAAVAVGLYVRDVFGDATALKAVALFVFFPASYILNVAYAEGLLFTAIAACLLYIRRERWVGVIVWANIACLSKESGVALVVAIAAEALFRGGRAPIERLRLLMVAAASSITFVGFCVYGWVRTGYPLAFVSAEKNWNSRFVWFRTPLQVVWKLLTSRTAWHEADLVVAGCGVFFLVAGVVYLVRLHRQGEGVAPAWWGYTAMGVLIAFSPYWSTSILRYSMVALVVLAPAFARVARQRLFECTLGAFGVLQGAIAIVIFVGLVNGHALLAP